MPDSSMLAAIAGIILILAILGVLYLRSLFVRFIINVLENPAGRITLGILLCIGGLNFAFNSNVEPYQNHWLVGGGIAGGGLLLIVITLGIPFLSKRWEKASAAKASPAGQTWSTSVSTPPPGIPYMPTPQPGGFLPPPIMPTPQPGGFLPMLGMPAPQPGGTLPAPNMPAPMPGNMSTQSSQPGGFMQSGAVKQGAEYPGEQHLQAWQSAWWRPPGE